jgi:hypothetical protein
MSTNATPHGLAQSARRVFVDSLVRGSAAVSATLLEVLQQRLLKPAESRTVRANRDTLAALQQHGPSWQMGLIARLRAAHRQVTSGAPPAESPSSGMGVSGLSLVGDDTIVREIASSRLALALQGDAQWQFTDLRTRMQFLERSPELSAHDLLRPQIAANLWVDAWYGADLTQADWQTLSDHHEQEFVLWLGAAYHDANHFLVEQGVRADVDLRPFIRRTKGLQAQAKIGQSFSESTASPPIDAPSSGGLDVAGAARSVPAPAPQPALSSAPFPGAGSQQPVHGAAQSPANLRASEVLAQMQEVLNRHLPQMGSRPSLAGAPGSMHQGAMPPGYVMVPGVAYPAGVSPVYQVADGAGLRAAPMDAEGLVKVSPRLQAVIQRAQDALRRPAQTAKGVSAGASGTGAIGAPASQSGSASGSGASPAALDEVRARSQAFKQVLKQAAASPEERATIEIVAMMFQSILQEERLPAAVRVWFARLQMPVLRVAVVEPDFFATNDHPARALIDRMGACVLGFDAAQAVGEVLEREIKRVVQVVEAYPDTGSRVFKTVLTEFESFLSNFFAKDNPASRKGVSLAQQVEQRETLAIQYTIELRKMLADMSVDDALREFLFQVWADVLAVTAMRDGNQADTTKLMKRAAADLIWSSGAKTTPEERAEVIRRLPLLLKTLRDGMGYSGLPAKKQDEHIRRINNVLATAFTTKAAPISRDRLDELFERLQTLESMLPNLADIDLDEDLVRDLSGHEREGLEVVAEGGEPPSDAMYAWARELPVGGWFKLQFRGRSDTVQLAWAGGRHALMLFVSPSGRAVLFPLHRLAAFLQAGLLQPAQEETLTVKATRDALARLEGDPAALLK